VRARARASRSENDGQNATILSRKNDRTARSRRNSPRDFRGETLSNETHASTTGPDVRLDKKATGAAARLCHMGHAVMENRSCLVADTKLTRASGTAEAEAAAAIIGAMSGQHRITVGAGKLFDNSRFVADMRDLNVTPHVAQNDNGRSSAVDGRTTRYRGYKLSLILRKGLTRHSAGSRRSGARQDTLRGTPRVDWMFMLAAAADGLIWLPKLLDAAAQRRPEGVCWLLGDMKFAGAPGNSPKLARGGLFSPRSSG
jgi:hypothetical protein